MRPLISSPLPLLMVTRGRFSRSDPSSEGRVILKLSPSTYSGNAALRLSVWRRKHPAASRSGSTDSFMSSIPRCAHSCGGKFGGCRRRVPIGEGESQHLVGSKGQRAKRNAERNCRYLPRRQQPHPVYGAMYGQMLYRLDGLFNGFRNINDKRVFRAEQSYNPRVNDVLSCLSNSPTGNLHQGAGHQTCEIVNIRPSSDCPKDEPKI